jgi:hypothetical protein
MMIVEKENIFKSLKLLERWVEEHNYKSYEPFDGLSSYLYPLTFNNIFFKRVLMQAVRRFPINIRPLLGIKPMESTKGRGYMAWGYLTMYKTTKEIEYKDKALDMLYWLDKNKADEFETHSWGNHFEFCSRGGCMPKHAPIIVWTCLIGQAFLDAYEITKENRLLEIIKSITAWVLGLPREKTGKGTCISYMYHKQNSIHNSNMLGAAFLARAYKFIKNEEMIKLAKEAMTYSCSRQLQDGAWWYGEADFFHWIDNFHTGYNLDSLRCYIDNSGDKEFDDNLRRGFEYFKNNFFEESGRSKYYNNKTFPVDSQCIGQAIETLAKFSDYDKDSLNLGIKAANWAIDNMQDKKGYFYFRQYSSGIKDKTPMLHWSQAVIYNGLSELYSKL